MALSEGQKGSVSANEELNKAASDMKLTFFVKQFGISDDETNTEKAAISIEDVIDQYI